MRGTLDPSATAANWWEHFGRFFRGGQETCDFQPASQHRPDFNVAFIL